MHFVKRVIYRIFFYLLGTPPPGASTAKPGTPANLQARTCTFEASNICRYTQDKTDNFDWSRDTSGTTSLGTGPRTDHTYGTRRGKKSAKQLWWVFDDIWAMSGENLFLPCGNNRGADQFAHPRSPISAFVVRCLDSTIHLVSISEISSLYIASVTAQASLSLIWLQTPKTGFSRGEAQIKG